MQQGPKEAAHGKLLEVEEGVEGDGQVCRRELAALRSPKREVA